MGQRYILALVLMIVVMFAWSLFFGNRLSKQRSAQKERQTSEQSRETQSSHSEEDVTNADGQQRTDEIEPRKQNQQSTEVHVRTEHYEITFATNPDAGTVSAKKWLLRAYPVSYTHLTLPTKRIV